MGHNTKTASRTQAIGKLGETVTDHADAILELRRIVRQERGVNRVGREAAREAILQLRAYLELPWWKRFLIQLKGEHPWKQPAQSSSEKDREASEAQTGERSSI